MKKIIRLTESDITRIVKRVIKENDDHTAYNYFKIVDEDGEVVGVGGVEVGSENEIKLIEDIFNSGYRPVKITKQEYDDFEDYDDEIRNF